MRGLITALAFLTLGGCAWLTQDHLILHETTYDHLPCWRCGDQAEAAEALAKSCAHWQQKAYPQTEWGGVEVSASAWQGACEALIGCNKNNACTGILEQRFTPYTATSRKSDHAFLTGYYVPELKGSLTPDARYPYPVYGVPENLTQGEQALTRASIENGSLEGKNLEVAWTDDPIALFFMQVQGSGRLRLPDGSAVTLGYAGKNGHPYASIGKILADRGVMEKDAITLFTLREWMYAHPEEARELMSENASYVFFRVLPPDWPEGAQGVKLTPARSLAVDPAFIPYGTPVFVNTQMEPIEELHLPLNRLMIAQDTGGAIKGPLRGDIFFGGGEGAEQMAGRQRFEGDFYILLPRELP